MKKQASFIFIFFFLLASSLLLLSSCTDKPGEGDEFAQLDWGTAALCIENPIAEGDSLCYHIEFKLDTLAGESELAKSLSAVLCDSVIGLTGHATILQAMQAFADSTEAEWKPELAERYADMPEYRDILQYYYNVEGTEVKTPSNSPSMGRTKESLALEGEVGRGSVLSYQVTTSCYLGGAHGSYVVDYYNFDIESGKLLNISDVVPADKEALALKAMQEQLCKDWEAKDLADLQEKTGITMLGDLYLTNNFLLRGDSIEFLFNQYEIAPYAAGLISVTIKRP